MAVCDGSIQTDSCTVIDRHMQTYADICRHMQTYYKGKNKGTQYKTQSSHPKKSKNDSPPPIPKHEESTEQETSIWQDPRWDIVLEKLKILDKYEPPVFKPP